MKLRTPFLLAFLFVMLTNVACRGTMERWVEVRVDSVDNKDLHEKCLFVINKAELKVTESDSDAGLITTEWDEHLYAFYRPRAEGGAGYRERAHVEIHDADMTSEERERFVAAGRTNPKIVRVRVERERNEEMDKPASPEKVKWEPDRDNADRAYRIAAMIQNQTSIFEPSDDFNKRFQSLADPEKSKDTKNGSKTDNNTSGNKK